jgi:hypothetical protein
MFRRAIDLDDTRVDQLLEYLTAAPDRRWNPELRGADRHMRSDAAVLGHQAGDSRAEYPIESRIRRPNGYDFIGEIHVLDFGVNEDDRRSDRFPSNEIRLSSRLDKRIRIGWRIENVWQT